jgi:hypothetical protein
MAASTLVLTFTWENKEEFKLEANADGAGDVTIIEMTENGEFAKLWDKGVKTALTEYLDMKLDEIGIAMKA